MNVDSTFNEGSAISEVDETGDIEVPASTPAQATGIHDGTDPGSSGGPSTQRRLKMRQKAQFAQKYEQRAQIALRSGKRLENNVS